jgi:hypothetical protein
VLLLLAKFLAWKFVIPAIVSVVSGMFYWFMDVVVDSALVGWRWLWKLVAKFLRGLQSLHKSCRALLHWG